MSVHFTCPSKRGSDPYLAKEGLKTGMCPGHRGQCAVLGESRERSQPDTFRLVKPLKESSDRELVELARKYNLHSEELHHIAEGD